LGVVEVRRARIKKDRRSKVFEMQVAHSSAK